MDMKNTVILLIFLLSILGLIIGVYYSDDVNSNITSFKRLYNNTDGIETITLEKKEIKNLDNENLNSIFNITPITISGRQNC